MTTRSSNSSPLSAGWSLEMNDGNREEKVRHALSLSLVRQRHRAELDCLGPPRSLIQERFYTSFCGLAFHQSAPRGTWQRAEEIADHEMDRHTSGDSPGKNTGGGGGKLLSREGERPLQITPRAVFEEINDGAPRYWIPAIGTS